MKLKSNIEGDVLQTSKRHQLKERGVNGRYKHGEEALRQLPDNLQMILFWKLKTVMEVSKL